MKRSDFVYFHRRRVEYAHTDMQGIVFYGNYLTFYDTAITEYMRDLGWDYAGHVEATGDDFHVVKASCDYADMATFDDWLDIGVRCSRLGRTSVAFETAAFKADADKAICTGEIVWVNTNQTTHKSTPMSAAFREAVKNREGAALE